MILKSDIIAKLLRDGAQPGATDPLVYFVSVLTMMLMALVASALPASRAASADPIDALRSI